MNKIIWALFDDGYGSWNKLGKTNILSFGCNENKEWKNYYKIDLSITNENLIKQLEKLPKPDIIIASPPCESWSIANNQQRLWRIQKGRNIEVFTQQDINNNNNKHKPQLKRYYYRSWKTTLLGISTALATAQIIQHFKPKIWIIENPKTSKIWEFFNENIILDGKIENNTYYNNYNDVDFSKKPTKFLSNINLNLKNDNSIKSKIKCENVSGYNKRSAIPKE